MPILKQESDIYPLDLLEESTLAKYADRTWWCVYTLSRREKDLMRKLLVTQTPYYGPMIPKRYRSPKGRLRTSYIPMFPNYVFMLATEEERSEAMKTNCISRCDPIDDRDLLVADLRQILFVVQEGEGLTPEARLESGNRVRVRSGPFGGFEGEVVRREGKTRLLLSIQYLKQGVSMELDEALLEPI